jgi:Skp family chaperone for outer membrane proteins
MLVQRQLDERQRLQTAITKMRETRAQEVAEIRKEIAAYVAMKRSDVPSLDAAMRAKEITQDKSQTRKRDDQLERVRRERTRERSRTQGFDHGPDF